MKLVYVAGPFRAPTPWDVEQNIRVAEGVGLRVALAGLMPLIPHTNTRFFDGQCTAQFWIDGTMEMLKRCDAIVLCPGWMQSEGSRGEWEYAKSVSMPIYDLNEKSPLIDFETWLERL